MATKKGRTPIFFPCSSFLLLDLGSVVRDLKSGVWDLSRIWDPKSWIWKPGWKKLGFGINNSDPQHLGTGLSYPFIFAPATSVSDT